MDIQTQFNNRPITYLEDDLGPRTLTPNAILYIKDLHLLENDEDITNDDIFTKSERRIKLKREHMWRSWVGEYLRSLRERHELHNGKQTFPQIREIVLIESESKSRREWRKDMVTKLIKGKDDIVRGVKLRVGQREWERPVQAIYPMEIRALTPENIQTDEITTAAVRVLPSRKAKSTGKDALAAQTLFEDDED